MIKPKNRQTGDLFDNLKEDEVQILRKKKASEEEDLDGSEEQFDS